MEIKTILDNFVDAIIIIDEKGMINYMNPAAERITGQRHEQAKGNYFKIVFNINDDAYCKKIEDLLQGLRQEEKSAKLTSPALLTSTGKKEIPIISNFSLIKDKQNKNIGGILIFQDYTQEWMTEQLLKESKERYRKLVESTTDAIIVYRPGKIVFANPAAAGLIGANSVHELIGKSILNFVHPDYKNELQEHISNILENGKTAPFIEEKFIKLDGTLVDVEVVATRIIYENKPALQIVVRDITDRKQAEMALHRSENLFRSVWENSFDGMRLCDENGTIIMVNDAFCRLTGKKRHELEGEPMSVIYYESEQKHVLEQHIKRFKSKTIKRYLLRKMRLFDNREVWFELSNSFIYAGEYLLLLSIFRDITERKKVEEALAESEKRYRTIVETSHDGILIVDENYKFVYVNDQFCKIVGYSEKELIGRDFRKFLAEESKDIVAERYKRRQRGEEVPPKYEFYIIRKDGQKRIVEISSTVIKDSRGKIQTISQIKDITDRKQAEKDLRESEEKYRNLIEQSNDAIFLLFNGKYELINRKFQEMFGVTQEETLRPDFNFLQLVAPKSKQMVQERMRYIASGESVEPNYQFTAITRDGKEIEVEASVSHIKYKGGIATQGILRDITERKQLQDELLQAQKMESIGKLAAGIAHDFNNLLTVINGYSNLLILDPSLPDGLKKKVEQIHKAGQQAAGLTNQLLAFSRKQVIHPKVVDLNQLIINMEKMLRRVISENIELIVKTTPFPIPITIDPAQLDQVLLNLAVNARDAMPDGGRLFIETSKVHFDYSRSKRHPFVQKGQYARLIVSDTGVGMDKETQAHIFEPFFTTKGVGHGTGLGLSTVYGIVKQNNGFILVNSKPGKGTTFRLYFPVASDDIEAMDHTTQVRKNNSLIGTETILLVEDEDAVRKFISDLLTEYGYHILSASSPDEGLEIFRQKKNQIDLLISDIIMPGMNGKELFEKLSKFKPDLKVLYISGYAADIISKLSIMNGHVKFIQKPIKMNEFLKVLRDILDVKNQ
ncbi:MAG: PAS domain S-box protein [Calditrichaeota bacterium]|nr:PAS domain S-box protein [Calditrichota bacterium]